MKKKSSLLMNSSLVDANEITITLGYQMKITFEKLGVFKVRLSVHGVSELSEAIFKTHISIL